MAQLFEGDCVGKVINPEIGESRGKVKVKWEMIVSDGDHKGKRASYSGKLDAENIKFTKRDMLVVGWKGKDVRTFVSDVKAADLTVPFSAEIAETTYEDSGKTSRWTSAKFSGGAPLAVLDKDKADAVNRWFAEAGDITSHGAKDSDEKLPF
jgi:hypothetical protein